MARLILKLEQDEFSVSSLTPMVLDFKIVYDHPKKIYEFSRECFTETSIEIINEVLSGEIPIGVTICCHDITYIEDVRAPVIFLPEVILVPAYQPLPLLTKVFDHQLRDYEKFLDEHEDMIPIKTLEFEHMKIHHHQELWHRPNEVIKEVTYDHAIMKRLNYQGLVKLSIDNFEYENVSELGIKSLGFENEISFSIDPYKFTYLDDINEEEVGLVLSEFKNDYMPEILKFIMSGDTVMPSIIRNIQDYDKFYFSSNPAPRLDESKSLILTTMPNYGIPYVPDS